MKVDALQNNRSTFLDNGCAGQAMPTYLTVAEAFELLATHYNIVEHSPTFAALIKVN
jgi:hypothetical protein